MDDPCRTFQRSEEKFFLECDTGRVPVVAIFTKFEALRPFAYGEIKKELKGVSSEERSKRIAERVEELFTKTGVCDRLCNPENRARPKSYVRLQNMNKQNTNCDALLESTTLALDDEELRLCLVSTQQSNMELCMKCAITILVDRAHQLFVPLRFDYGAYQYGIARWFSHLKVRERLIQSDDSLVMMLTDAGKIAVYEARTGWTALIPCCYSPVDSGRQAEVYRDNIISILQPLVGRFSSILILSTVRVQQAPKALMFANQIIQTGIATIIVLEYSAFLPNDLGDLERVKSAVDYYMKSPTAVAVEKGAKEICRQGYDREEMGKKILEFILENRLSKDLTEKK
ncbi:uncharacterized protein HD556DRAFT_1488300 [Suillus plorans]|uniref:Uncharacterized protein n=1 Tax=Suillus plorans TaxID=116603 RepID=A0A9P7AJ77_9AGAM|nr:uncharacterized protein HD556DRAFT_1488300 [Suillus plorans]KAG1790648.1 hypothetical protein HD556DRAFT_1488300 [Suillus plorans]